MPKATLDLYGHDVSAQSVNGGAAGVYAPTITFGPGSEATGFLVTLGAPLGAQPAGAAPSAVQSQNCSDGVGECTFTTAAGYTPATGAVVTVKFVQPFETVRPIHVSLTANATDGSYEVWSGTTEVAVAGFTAADLTMAYTITTDGFAGFVITCASAAQLAAGTTYTLYWKVL